MNVTLLCQPSEFPVGREKLTDISDTVKSVGIKKLRVKPKSKPPLPCGGGGFNCYLVAGRTEVTAAVAVAIAAVHRAISLGLERELRDGDATLGALETEGRDVDKLALGEATLGAGRTILGAAVAVAIAAVHRAISLGLEREFRDVDAAAGALETESGDVEGLARAETLRVVVIHIVG
jgi:hypothetical protein